MSSTLVCLLKDPTGFFLRPKIKLSLNLIDKTISFLVNLENYFTNLNF